MNVFCLALKVDKEAYLPLYWFKNLEQVPLFKEACLARYQAMGTWLRNKDQTTILQGIYAKDPEDEHKIVCIYDMRPDGQKYRVELEDFYESVEIVDPWSLKTSVKLEKGRRTVLVDDLYSEFTDHGVTLPPIDIENDWLQFLHNTEDNKVKFALKEEFVVAAAEGAGEGAVAETIHKRPVKQRRLSGASESSSGEAESSSGTGLSAALSGRLARLS